MTTFTLTINTDNAAFEDGLGYGKFSEIVRCVTSVAEKLADGNESGSVRDINGNTVGKFELSED